MARPTRRTWQLGIDEAWHVLKNGAPLRIKLRTHTQLKLLAIFLPPMVRRPSAPTSASRAAVGHLSTPHDSVRLERSGIVVLSSGAVEALRPRISRTRSIAVKAMALEEMHSRIKLMIPTAVGRRGKWRTLWRGVTIKPGQP